MKPNASIRIGAVGCGNISETYFRNLGLFPGVQLVACSDLDPVAAQSRAAQFGITAVPFMDMLRRDDIDVVLNLTVPSVHAELSLAAIDAGKHVFSEKPLATSFEDGVRILDAAAAKGVRVGAAPDTFLGPGIQIPRRLMDQGVVGDVVTGTAGFLSHGMEHWHPNPAFFYHTGGGPVLDMGPYYLASLVALLGPVKRVVANGRIGTSERLVTAEGPLRGRTVPVHTPTTFTALISFQSGAETMFIASWDVWKHSLPPIELHGRDASLRLPDPDLFGGSILLATGRTAYVAIDTTTETFGRPYGRPQEPQAADYRGVGLADMAAAIRSGRPHRCSGELALHVLATLLGILESAREGRAIDIPVSCNRPAALGNDESALLLHGGV